jgi:hypothetical protein
MNMVKNAMSTEPKRVIFVHNDDNGVINSIKSISRKFFKKENDGCNLCTVIFKGKNNKQAWNAFTKNLKIDFQYMRRNLFLKQFHRNDDFPVVYLAVADAMTVLISKEKLNVVKDVQELKELMIDRLDTAGIIETHF